MPLNLKIKPHDRDHPYVRKLVGCGHGLLWKEYCRDCELVRLNERYENAMETIESVKKRLTAMGVEYEVLPSMPKTPCNDNA